MTTATFTLSQSNASLLAFIFDGICRINQTDRHDRMEAGRVGLAEEVGTSEDRLLSAAMMISAQAVELLKPALDFHSGLNEPSVFEYDFLDYSEDAGVENCCSLSAFIWKFLCNEPSYWLLAAEHLRPQDVPLESVITEWRVLHELI